MKCPHCGAWIDHRGGLTAEVERLYESGLQATEIRDLLQERGFFKHYKAKPLISVHGMIKRYKAKQKRFKQ